MAWDFWLGLLLSLPLAILANLVTPKIKERIEKKAEEKSLKEIENILTEYREIKEFKLDSALFHSYLISIVIKTTFVGSVTGIVAGIYALFSHLFRGVEYWGGFSILSAVGPNLLKLLLVVFSLVFSLLILQLSSEGIRMYNRVKKFDEYEKRVRDRVGKLPDENG